VSGLVVPGDSHPCAEAPSVPQRNHHHAGEMPWKQQVH
jgi:hypothetical protein